MSPFPPTIPAPHTSSTRLQRHLAVDLSSTTPIRDAGGVNKAWLNHYIFAAAEIQKSLIVHPAKFRRPFQFIEKLSHLEASPRPLHVRLPARKGEGYADYVARDPDFVFAEQFPAHQGKLRDGPNARGCICDTNFLLRIAMRRLTPGLERAK